MFTEIAARHGATAHRKPMELGKIFPQTGGLPLPKRAPARLAAGVFGAPSYVLDDELYWGQDRLDFLDRVLGDS